MALPPLEVVTLANPRKNNAPMIPPAGARPYSEGRNSCMYGPSVSGTGKIEILHPPDDPTEVIEVHFHGGAQIQNASVQLLFWGNVWNDPANTPSAGDVMAAVQNVLSGPYMTRLDQYGIGPATLRGGLIVQADPPNPFARGDWHGLIWDLIGQGTFPWPSDPGGRILYMIVTPPQVVYEDAGVCGTHGYPAHLDVAHGYIKAWAGFALNAGTMDSIMASISHEIVEACTDPEDDGWTITSLSPPDDEICDICENTTAYVNGVLVMGYWSVEHNACIIPLAPRQTRWQVSCINKPNREDVYHSLSNIGGTDGNGNPYLFTKEQAIDMIKGGHTFYVNGADGSTSTVEVVLHYPPGYEVSGIEYLQTTADRSKEDNLLSLPECPRQ